MSIARLVPLVLVLALALAGCGAQKPVTDLGDAGVEALVAGELDAETWATAMLTDLWTTGNALVDERVGRTLERLEARAREQGVDAETRAAIVSAAAGAIEEGPARDAARDAIEAALDGYAVAAPAGGLDPDDVRTLLALERARRLEVLAGVLDAEAKWRAHRVNHEDGMEMVRAQQRILTEDVSGEVAEAVATVAIEAIEARAQAREEVPDAPVLPAVEEARDAAVEAVPDESGE